MIVWIVDDGDQSRKLHELEFQEMIPDAVVYTFEVLCDASRFVVKKSPDFIFIDLSTVDGWTLPCSDNHSYIGNLRQFVERFRSSFIVIMSALVSHAEEDVEDLRIACGDNHLFSLDPCKKNALIDFCLLYGRERP